MTPSPRKLFSPPLINFQKYSDPSVLFGSQKSGLQWPLRHRLLTFFRRSLIRLRIYIEITADFCFLFIIIFGTVLYFYPYESFLLTAEFLTSLLNWDLTIDVIIYLGLTGLRLHQRVSCFYFGTSYSLLYQGVDRFRRRLRKLLIYCVKSSLSPL